MSVEEQKEVGWSILKRRAYQKKVINFPFGILALPLIDIATDQGPLFDTSGEDAILNVFTGDSYSVADFQANSWTVIADSVVDQVADLLQINSALDGDQSFLFAMLGDLTKNELRTLTKYGWKTRIADKASMSEMTAYAFVALLPGALLYAVLKSAVHAWVGQCNDAVDELIDYHRDRPETWRAKLTQDHFGAISGTDLDIIKPILMEIIHKRIFLPKEIIHIGNKLIGSLEMYLPAPHGAKETLLKQIIDVYYVDQNMWSSHVLTPKVTGTMLVVVNMLKAIGYFYDNLSEISKFISYHDKEAYDAWINAFEMVELSFEELISWPRCELPWFLYYFGTHYDDAQTRLELITIAYNSDKFFGAGTPASAYFRRESSVGVDPSYWVKIRALPGYSEQEILTSIYIGYFLRCAFFSTNLTSPDTDLSESVELGVDDRDTFAVFRSVISYDNQGEIINELGLATPTLQAGESGWTNKTVYSAFIIPQDDGASFFRNPFKISTAQLANVADPTTSTMLIGSTNDNYIIDTTLGSSVWDDVYPLAYYEGQALDRHKFIPFLFDFYNPIVVKENQKPKEFDPSSLKRSSSLKHDSYSKSDDVEELTKYIKDLEAEIALAKESEHTQEVVNREKTIERVRARIEEIKKKKSSTPDPGDVNTAAPTGGDD